MHSTILSSILLTLAIVNGVHAAPVGFENSRSTSLNAKVSRQAPSTFGTTVHHEIERRAKNEKPTVAAQGPHPAAEIKVKGGSSTKRHSRRESEALERRAKNEKPTVAAQGPHPAAEIKVKGGSSTKRYSRRSDILDLERRAKNEKPTTAAQGPHPAAEIKVKGGSSTKRHSRRESEALERRAKNEKPTIAAQGPHPNQPKGQGQVKESGGSTKRG